MDRCGHRQQSAQRKGEAGFPPPLGAFYRSAGSTGPAESHMIHRLLGRFRHRDYRDESTAVGFRTKLDTPFNLRKESIVVAHADIKAGVPGRAALTRNDVAGNHMLAAISLDAEAFARGIAPVT